MTIPRATLGGFPLRASIPEGWMFVEGATPSMTVVGLRPADAQSLLDNNDRPVDLILADAEKDTLIVKNLWVLHEVPDDNPNVRSVMVSDWRWMWANANIEGDFNVRRNVGLERYVDGLTDETAVNSAIVTYWPWSLKGEGKNGFFDPWLVSEVVEKVLTKIKSINKAVNHKLIILKGNGEKEKTDRTTVENLTFKGDGGDAAINRLKSIVPGMGITLDENSDVVVYRKDMNGPREISDVKLGPISSSKGIFVKINNRLMRPAKINVKMEYEVEIRMDAVEAAGGGTVAQRDPQDLYLQNVAPIPDPTLLINGQVQCQGTWAIFGTEGDGKGLISAWNATTDDQITRKMIREAMVPLGIDLFSRLALTGLDAPRLNLVARCLTIQNHYRTTYQISPFWINRIRSLRPWLISTINLSTGGRAPAVCYSNIAVTPSVRGKLTRSIDDQFVFLNIKGYPDNGLLFPQAGASEPVQVAPCEVQILDADQGIIHLKFDTDAYGNQESIVPSYIDNVPNTNLKGSGARAGRITVDSVADTLANAELPELSDADTKAILLSASPASPNDDRRLYTIVVTPEMVKSFAGVDVGECVGPEMDIFIGPNMVTCKVGWRDVDAYEIKKIFGFGSGNPKIDHLILNNSPTGTPIPQNSASRGASILESAIAWATQMYIALADRIEGEQASHFNPSVKLSGWEESVHHVLTAEPNSKFLTIVKFEQRRPRLSISEFMDSSMRRAIFRLAQPAAVS